jgi:uncharacterized protein YuzE
MRLKYDPEADAVYIYLSDGQYAYGKDLDSQRRVDYDADSTPIGIELLCVSRGVNPDDLPEQGKITEMLAKKHIKVFA